MAGAIIAPALPVLQEHFADVGNAAFWVRLVLTIPSLFIVVGAPLAGYALDRWGRKPVLLVALLVYGLAGSSGYLVDSLTLLLIGRAVLGLAVAGIMTGVTTLISDYFDGAARAQFLGFQSAFMGLGGTIFLAFGGVLAESEWRLPFLIYGLAFFVFPLILALVYEPQRPINWASEVPIAPSLERLSVGFVVFVYGLTFIVQIAFNLVPVHLPFMLQALFGAGGSESGQAIAFMPLAFSIGAIAFGWFVRRFSRITIMTTGFLLAAVGYWLLGQAVSWPTILVALPIGGFGLGLVMPNLNSWLAGAAPAAMRGRILGGFTTAVFLGQFLSPIVSQPFIDSSGIAPTYALTGALLLALALGLTVIGTRLVTAIRAA